MQICKQRKREQLEKKLKTIEEHYVNKEATFSSRNKKC